jgi:large conductance mechanosensitive channel
MSTLLQEFKEFAMKGNVVDLAVGVIIGGAFGKIVSSLVADLVMPAISPLTGGVSFVNLKWTLLPEQIDAAGKVLKAAVTLNYGNFFQNVFDFLIVAAAIFAIVKMMNSLKRTEPAAEAAPAAPCAQEVLLGEIRDLLKKG